jgi:HTH-type transcriptional regulator/antitoxin HigA
MSTQTINPTQYGKLLSRVLPQPIKTEREYDRIVAEAGRLMSRGEENLSPEEASLLEVMAILIENHDREHHPVDKTAPHELLAYLMEQRNLKPRDLWAVLESKSRVSEILSGKRAISRAQAKKLAEYFRVSAELFL